MRRGKPMSERKVGRMTMKSTRRVLGHSAVRLFVHSHRSLIRLLRTAASLARSAALIRSLARSLTRSRAQGKEVYFYELNASISQLQPKVHPSDQKFQKTALHLK